jgi:hypothetical protein
MTDLVLTTTLMVAVVGIFACSDDPLAGPEVYTVRPTVPEQYDFLPITVDGIDGVIVPATVLQARSSALGAWTPTREDVIAFERSGCAQVWINECTERGRESRDETYVAAQYVRQYMGAVSPWEGRVLSARLMCEPLYGYAA